ncbi:MAG: PduL/EutD family phosphate acyltransferase, partial [Clostridia bacterium]
MENLKVVVETSSRHVHVTQADLETLFGAGAELHHKRDLSQPGQFLSEEKVQVVGPKRSIDGVSILGPVRPATQVEISLTDARTLGITAPVRESGKVSGSAGVKIVGPAGEIELSEGAIAAKRHIHLTPADAAKYGLNDQDIVSVDIEGDRA